MQAQSIGQDWRMQLSRRLPGVVEQVELNAATTFEVEMPSVREWHFDLENAKRITQPILWVVGADERSRPAEMRQQWRNLLPQIEDLDIIGTNHWLQFDTPTAAARVAEGIEAFLTKHPLS
jgi:pimeloyl-ACP methyl ester carboxylesterase